MTQLTTIETTVQKTNALLGIVEKAYGWQDRQYSYHAVRAVLHAVRDRLPVEHAAHLASQFTPLLAGIYYEGWDPSRVPIKMHRDEFIERIQNELIPTVTSQVDIEDLVKTVIAAISSTIDPHEVEKIREVLPKDLSELLAYVDEK